jgi:DNA-binding protein H-NS
MNARRRGLLTSSGVPLAEHPTFAGLFHPTMTPEQEAVLRSIRKLVDFWRITPGELGGIPAGAPARVPAPAKPAPRVPVVKYRHPITLETWDGEGPQPPWLRDALTREGYTVDELRAAPPASGG